MTLHRFRKAQKLLILALVLSILGFQPPVLGASSEDACRPVNRNGQSVNLGLPRSPLLVTSSGNIPILVAVVDFSNAKATESVESEVSGFELQKVKDFYQQSSYGKANLEFTIVDEVLRLPIADTNVSELTISQQASRELPSKYILNNYEGLLIIATRNSSYSSSSASAEAKVENGTGKLFSFAVLAGVKPTDKRWLSSPWLTVSHELGHMMGLMDLWNREDSAAWQGKTAAPFSLMNTGAGWNFGPDFFGWEKYILGWLDETEFMCLSQNNNSLKGSIFPLSSKTGLKLVIIPSDPTQYIALEFREKSTLDYGIAKSGILAYKIDFEKRNFEVPITLFPSPEALVSPLANNFQDWQRFKSAPLGKLEIVDVGIYRVANLGGLSLDNFWISTLSIADLSAALLEQQKTADKAAADKAAADKASSAKKTTIICFKGKLTKKVTAVKPKCPAGYKKK